LEDRAAIDVAEMTGVGAARRALALEFVERALRRETGAVSTNTRATNFRRSNPSLKTPALERRIE
jgi:hypothetical protein